MKWGMIIMNKCTCNCPKCKDCIQKQKEAAPTTEVSNIPIAIWFDRWRKESYIILYKTMLETYNTTNELVYSNLNDRYNQYKEEEYNEIMNRNNGSYSDPADIDFTEVGSEAAYRVERDLLMKYQYHFSSLVNLYHVFEQQIRKLLYTELNHRSSRVRTKKDMPEFATKFGEIKDVLTKLKYPYATTPSWSTIDELNKITNTYKHGDGPSAKRLYRKDKDIFANNATKFFYYEEPKSKQEERAYINSLDAEELEIYREREGILVMENELTTNAEIVLRQDKTPFEKYVNAIIDFWNAFPEHYSTYVEIEVEVEDTDLP